MDALAGLDPHKKTPSRNGPEVTRVVRHLRSLGPDAVRRVAAVIELIEPKSKSPKAKR